MPGSAAGYTAAGALAGRLGKALPLELSLGELRAAESWRVSALCQITIFIVITVFLLVLLVQ